MLHLELSDEEQRTLREILERALPNLEVEIHRTDRLEFKETLQQRRDVLKRLLDKVAQAENTPSSR